MLGSTAIAHAQSAQPTSVGAVLGLAALEAGRVDTGRILGVDFGNVAGSPPSILATGALVWTFGMHVLL